MRSSAVALAIVVTFVPVPALAQDFGLQAAVDKLNQQVLGDPQDRGDQQPPDQKPPAAVGETGTKPTRGFVKSLLYNLGDDVKHMPRRNSLYWLAGGSIGALAIHPADQSINQHLATSQSANIFFAPGAVIGQGYFILPAAVGTYIFGRVQHEGRVTHLGMDEIEAALLSEGIV